MTHKYIKTKNTIVSILLAAVVVTSASCGCQKKPDSVATPTPKPTEVAIVTEAPTTEPENTESSDATILPDSGTSVPGTEATAEAPSAEATAAPETDSTELPASEEPSAAATVSPTAKPSERPSATAAPTATPKATAKPTATPTVAPTATPKPTAAPTTKPTVKPTAKPTATPTPKPTTSSEYPWSNEVTSYLTDSSRGWGYLEGEVTTTSELKPTLAGTIFGNLAVGTYGGAWGVDGEPMYYEKVNSNGVIAQAYENRYFDGDLFEWVNEKRVTGVYLDVSYAKPGVEPDTTIPFELQQYQELVTYNVFGVAVTVEQNKTNDMSVNFYPLSSGDFVLELGSVPVILDEIPETVLVRGGPTTSGLNSLQISVNGHVVYETEWLGGCCRF